MAVQKRRAGTWGTGRNEQLQEVGLTGLRDGPHVGAEEPRRKGGDLLGQADLEAPVGHQGEDVWGGGSSECSGQSCAP